MITQTQGVGSNSMLIAIASDLHLEFGDITLKNTEAADVLILSGDILIVEDLRKFPRYEDVDTVSGPNVLLGIRYPGQKAASMYRNFLDNVSAEFKHVIYVAGNHEFYHGKWDQTIEVLRAECAGYENIHFLECDTTVIEDVTFTGGTLWTDCNKQDPLTLHGLTDCMTDFRVIKNEAAGYTRLRPIHTVDRHDKTKKYIKHVLDNTEGKVVVVGHHAPSSLSVHERFVRDFLMNGGYYSDLSEFILDNPKIVLWTHGHMHDPCDYMIGDTRVVCNPRGYIGQESCADEFKLKYVEV
ncbi:Calcineurin-like phosphoesterase domain, ApaH type [uncultured Caudovirales phage]|uniref:Calcineurin-like phosphoesterase domain, ApaH type n=1 Tax=uncultured Caudovirales phage TaxID=2100421 RepID=A0A6J5P8D6_9CAUD|nr:Calcineurin-like phosphoesterase domain, ApaH type [uncultured Caudovirales phage]CAB4165507.1 Calcineurin-like phosphoesterase domain, ApaH type [uncultured Caudovirales phage]CAB4186834.1 Calcineurin-like phosphoesterase domain, ApaH type [uncultured Caudovirales phage]CAB4221562.1 Calcineurin-like phosphoesterase domain, ApaH type [uncultured Caudovirales phage]